MDIEVDLVQVLAEVCHRTIVVVVLHKEEVHQLMEVRQDMDHLIKDHQWIIEMDHQCNHIIHILHNHNHNHVWDHQWVVEHHQHRMDIIIKMQHLHHREDQLQYQEQDKEII